jgi:hypothetical protein
MNHWKEADGRNYLVTSVLTNKNLQLTVSDTEMLQNLRVHRLVRYVERMG